ncbi:hypothetical protein [Bacillus methanolicus]|uniref:Uncharacterized protein n=1 Tax=Bacillus methanolicus (strain MGA3 / ATCC 53907) TaxID=796606 RepID=I3E7D0_BACMM|nr:hypothetical protein [Bacillus methanolicus]AIE59229.1 hypothetical protein BMMGA3_03945 [Bacillus methanolicus MGA3]EIJ82401.1 hypothetical protein MGA3_04125 [Bacillus methanolicus MGA3]UQD51301.1 hypothetical protein C0971_04185 [Bacillus methanolicus]
MPICPICNGFKTLHLKCPKCNSELEESGRIMDYYDDYSPYMMIDHLKLEDGYPTTYSNHECPHFFYCPKCEFSDIELIKEQDLV